MARPKKEGVDYFSHDVNSTSGRTIFTLESKYGNDGYAFWFKLLEILGSQNNLCYDCTSLSNWLYLVARTKVSEDMATEILDTLSQIDAIDEELWHQKVIWVQKFSERLGDVFSKRGTETPQKPSFCHGNNQKSGVSVAESTQSKVKEIKGKESKENSTTRFDEFWDCYPKKVAKKDAVKAWSKISNDAFAEIMESLEKWKRSSGWTKDGGQFIPNAATWLNGERWKDEVPENPRKTNTTKQIPEDYGRPEDFFS